MKPSDARDIDRMARARNGSPSALGCLAVIAFALGCWALVFALLGWVVR